MNDYEVRGVAVFNGGMYGTSPAPVTKVEAEFYDTYEGELVFYIYEEMRNKKVASFAPGRWDNVVKVEYSTMPSGSVG